MPTESVNSVTWMPSTPLTLLVGTSYKYIRVFDFREYTNAKNLKQTHHFQAHNRSVYGLQFNPNDKNYFMSYSDDNSVKVWDMRRIAPVKEFTVGNMEKESSTSATKPINHVEWSPNQNNCLCVLAKSSIKLWDLSDSANKSLQYKISPYKTVYLSDDNVTSFSFHPTVPNCVLIASNIGVVRQLFITDHVKYSLSPLGCISSNVKESLIESNLLVDCSVLMRTRAKNQIGIDIDKNLEISIKLNDTPSTFVWSWFSKLRQLNENMDKKRNEYEYVGITSLFNSSSLPYKPIPILPSNEKNNIMPSIKTYSSPSRTLMLQICGWNDHASQVSFRSIAIAIFNLELKKATLLLTQMNQDMINYKFLAYALSGYSEDRRFEFRQVFESLTNIDPYLKAALGFLSYGGSNHQSQSQSTSTTTNNQSSSNNATNQLLPPSSTSSSPELDDHEDLDHLDLHHHSLSCVLQEHSISLNDRIAFASIYLNDDDLNKYLYDMTEKYTKNGSLEGILLTGIDQSGIQLMQSYVDRTGDVQLASLTMKQQQQPSPSPSPSPPSCSSLADKWLEEYRDLLDRWQMFEERALLDCSIANRLHEHNDNTLTIPKSAMVSVKCAFCDQALVHHALLSSRGGRMSTFTSRYGNFATRPKATGCPNCRKPLPKCAVCLMSFGSPSQSLGGTKSENEYGALDYCFSWCTKCKHGGHVNHLMQWFEKHQECSVSDCHCKCNTHK
ncbi:SEA/GATOR complex protein [Acrasis kona]